MEIAESSLKEHCLNTNTPRTYRFRENHGHVFNEHADAIQTVQGETKVAKDYIICVDVSAAKVLCHLVLFMCLPVDYVVIA